MSIKENTIASTTDTKVTLLKWLKDTNKALENDTLTGVEVRQKGNATFSFVLTFKDGSELESNEFVLAQGESINGATIRNGHLYLSLTNGDELDAGDLKPVSSFAINASQHLIVNYGDGTSQDLGAIFQGNVNIDGNLTANSIIENMQDYSYRTNSKQDYVTPSYVSVVKTGNKITFVGCANLNMAEGQTMGNYTELWQFQIVVPNSVASKLKALVGTRLDQKQIKIFSDTFLDFHNINANVAVEGNWIYFYFYGTAEANTGIVRGRDYAFRYEMTLTLSDNLVS